MIPFITQNKLLTGGVCMVVLALLYYFFFSGSSVPPLSTAESADSPVTQSLLVTLSNLHTIKLDGSIFKDPAFVSLTDFGVVIPPQNVGRRNPFAPLSAQAGASGASIQQSSALKLPTSSQ